MVQVRSHIRNGKRVQAYTRSDPPKDRGMIGSIRSEEGGFGTVATQDSSGRFTGRVATNNGDNTRVRRESNFGRIIGRTS